MPRAAPLWFSFQGRWRRVVYVGLYELLAIVLVTLALVAGDHGRAAAGVTAVGSSTIAVVWNWIFNALFERWEARQHTRGRSGLRRVAHAIGFEGGLAVWLLPFMAWTLGVGFMQALALEAGLLVFFLVYTFAFTWLFDHVFGLPAAAA